MKHEDAEFEQPMASKSGTAQTTPDETTPDEQAAVVPVPRADLEASTVPAAGEFDTLILDQAMLTAACELLPDRLATLTILPLQLRLVYTIGKRHGQALDLDQAQDLAAAFGVGAATQVVESVVRGTLGSVARGLFGTLLGSATGTAAGAIVTFASTYALGHAADRYYAQGRELSAEDLRTLFARFQGEAKEIYPRVEERIRQVAADNSFDSVLRAVRGG